MEVLRSNLDALLPHIGDCVKKSVFIALDTEFTGLAATTSDEFNLFDSIEQRYQKMKRVAKTFIICQFGLCAYLKDPTHKNNKTVDIPFRHRMYNSCVSISLTSISFFTKEFHTWAVIRGKQSTGFVEVIQLLQSAGKPLVGHNLLYDLVLLYEKFCEPLPNSYEAFKRSLHKMFPLLMDTKALCNALRKSLRDCNLLQDSNLGMLYTELSSQRGTTYALYTPDVGHADDSSKYRSEKKFHEAGFDAFITGFVFLRIAHLVALKGISSTEARPLPFLQYLQAVSPYANCINVSCGPVQFIKLDGKDVPCYYSWLTVFSRSRQPLSLVQLQELVGFGSVDVKFLSPTSAVLVTSERKAEHILQENRKEIYVRRYRPWDNQKFLGLMLLSGVTTCIGLVVAWRAASHWRTV